MIQNISADASKMLQEMLDTSKDLNSVNSVQKTDNGESFKDMLTNMLDDVDLAQKEADKSIEQLVTGESSSVQDVVLKMQEADVAFQLMKEVRDKLMRAYKEVMTMQQ